MQQIKAILRIGSSGVELTDEYGSRKKELQLTIGTAVELIFDLRSEEVSDQTAKLLPLAPEIFSSCKSFFFAVDSDYNQDTEPLLLVTGAIEKRIFASGSELCVKIANTAVPGLLAALGESECREFKCELAGIAGDMTACFSWGFPIVVRNRIYLPGNVSDSVASDPEYLNAAQVEALVARESQAAAEQAALKYIPGIGPDSTWIINGTDTGILAAGVDGKDAPQVLIEYSADGGAWSDTPENAVYIRFSADGGNTWSTHTKYVGSDAPQVLIEYSATGTANTWHDLYEQTDYYIRFSADGGNTWGNAMQFKAYPVIYQYGASASGDFHDTFNAAGDKYIRWSADNGRSWSAAAKFMGDKGDNFTINATGTLEGRSAYDSYPAGFSYLVTSGEQNGYIYFRISDTAGTWGDAIKFTPEGVAVEYSADGVVWSSTPDENTVYMRFSVDGGVSWKEAVQIKGTSTYIYTAYASDASGNNFSTTRSSDLDYWNWIYSNTPIAESDLTAERFSAQGSGWTQFQGDDGISYDWLSGTSAPAAGDGKDGDWYIDTAKGDMYKKISGNWVWQMNTVGKSGTGVTLKGEWDISTAYSKDDGVSYSGSFYIAKRSNTGKIPADSPDDWVLYVEKGEQGVPGAVLDGLYQDVTEISEDGFMVFDKKAVPCMVEIADRTFDIGEITVTDTAFKVPVAPLLAAADIAAFSGTWRVWFNGGAKGEKGNDGNIADFSNTVTFSANNIDLANDIDTISSYTLKIQDKNAKGLGAFIVHQGDNAAGENVIRIMLQTSNKNIPTAGIGIEIKRNTDGTYSASTFATPEPDGSASDSQIATTAWVQNAIKKALANQ